MISPEERRSLSDELHGYRIPLSKDPTLEGLTSSYQILAQLEAFKDRAAEIMCDALDDVRDSEKELTDANYVFTRKSSEKLQENIIKILKSGELRKAAVNTLLTRDLERIAKGEVGLLETKNFLAKANLTHSDLKDKIRTVKQQIEIYGLMSGHGEIRRGSMPPERGARIT